MDLIINLQTHNALLERIATALERIAGPVINPPSPPVQTQLKDIHTADPQTVYAVQEELEKFAVQVGVVPGSQAFKSALQKVEDTVREEFGDAGVEELPWIAAMKKKTA